MKFSRFLKDKMYVVFLSLICYVIILLIFFAFKINIEVIITNEADIHPNPVIDILNSQDLPFFRFNTDKILTDYDVLYEISNEKTFFEIKYKNYDKSITSEQITCVWERRPMEPLATYDHYDDEKVKKVILEEADGFIKFFRYSLSNVFWLGHPIIERQAGSSVIFCLFEFRTFSNANLNSYQPSVNPLTYFCASLNSTVISNLFSESSCSINSSKILQ